MKQLSSDESFTGSYMSYISIIFSSICPRSARPGSSSDSGFSVSTSAETNAMYLPFGATLWEWEQQNTYLPCSVPNISIELSMFTLMWENVRKKCQSFALLSTLDSNAFHFFQTVSHHPMSHPSRSKLLHLHVRSTPKLLLWQDNLNRVRVVGVRNRMAHETDSTHHLPNLLHLKKPQTYRLHITERRVVKQKTLHKLLIINIDMQYKQ
jgi:hypothetical protein